METFAVSEYLENYNKVTKAGNCKACQAVVGWKRERVASHKRRNCANVTREDQIFFAKRNFAASSRNTITHSSQDNSQNNSIADLSFVEIDKDEIDAAVANFFYRSGIAFRIADSPAWKKLIDLLCPAYAKEMPSAKVLSGKLLDQQYEKTSNTVKEILEVTIS